MTYIIGLCLLSAVLKAVLLVFIEKFYLIFCAKMQKFLEMRLNTLRNFILEI